MAVHWHIIPAGVLHGMLLAVIGVGTASLLRKRPVFLRWLVLPLVGWVAGWLSWVPVQISLNLGSSNLEVLLNLGFIWAALVWPLSSTGPAMERLLLPWFVFGLVSLLYCGVLALGPRSFSSRSLPLCILLGVLSGSLGCLLFWVALPGVPKYLSPLHGTIWGSLVGFGVWRAVKEAKASP